MFSHACGNIIEYQALNNRLKKRRILKKPIIADAGDQFESLGVRSEANGDLQTAGMCYRSAAKCSSSLGHFKTESNFLIKAARLFMKAELLLAENHFISTEENLQESLHCYHEACERLLSEDKVMTGALMLEFGRKFVSLQKPEAALIEFNKASELFKNSPLECFNCLQQILDVRIEQRLFEAALKVCTQAVQLLSHLDKSNYHAKLLENLETDRLLLLMLVEPSTSQVCKHDAELLEKFMWIDMGNNGELADLTSSLANTGLSVFNPDLFLLLQSLVMAAQSGDSENICVIELELQKFLSVRQKNLVKILGTRNR